MKYIKTLLLVLCAYTAFGQQQAEIEVRLSLVQQSQAQTPGELTLAISVINHTNQDVYIPSFSLFASTAGIHFYEKVQNKWKEFNIITRDYYKLYEVKKVGNSTYHDDPTTYFTDNTVSRILKDSVKSNTRFQDSILRKSGHAERQSQPWTMGYTPLFLKAGQEIKYYSVQDVSYLLTRKSDFKITFNTEERDKSYRFRDTVSKDTPPSIRFPAKVNEFKRLLPQTIVSNVLYFSSFFIDEKKNKRK